MTPALEERTRAAMDAIAGLVENVPPLRLPPPEAQGAARRHRWGVRGAWSAPGLRGSWLAPVTAAVAVLVIAIALVVVRDMPHARMAPPAPGISPAGAPVSFPRYYVTFSQPPGDTATPVSLVLADTLTGKKLFTLPPPRGLSFAGITAAADDRTFVADAHRDPYGVTGSKGRSRWWYLVRVTGTGTGVALTMAKLPIPPTPVGTVIAGIELSPDGTKLAVTVPFTTNNHMSQLLRVYSVATGEVLHTWSTAPRQNPIMGQSLFGADPNTSLAWVGEHAIAFVGSGSSGSSRASGSGYAIRELDLSRPDGDLLASSRPTAAVPVADTDNPAPYGCGPIFRVDVLVTGDGKSFVCGGTGSSAAMLPKLYCLQHPTWNVVGFAGFSLTGKGSAGILSGYRTGCFGYNVTAYPVWVNATGSTVIGYMIFGGKNSGMFGVFSKGSFRPLPYPVPGNSYQYQAGSLLYQVAW